LLGDCAKQKRSAGKSIGGAIGAGQKCEAADFFPIFVLSGISACETDLTA
jgi:hypothetical protein